MKRKLLEPLTFCNGRGEQHFWNAGWSVEIVHDYPRNGEVMVRRKTSLGMRRARIPYRMLGLKKRS